MALPACSNAVRHATGQVAWVFYTPTASTASNMCKLQIADLQPAFRVCSLQISDLHRDCVMTHVHVTACIMFASGLPSIARQAC